MKVNLSVIECFFLIGLFVFGEASRFQTIRRFPVSRASRLSGASKSEFRQQLENTIDEIFNKEYCHCTMNICKCCRHLAPPMFVPKSGLGCAKFKYLGDQSMLVTLKFDDQVIMKKKISSLKSTPTCIPLPDNIIRFCGKAYSLPRYDEPYKACFVLDRFPESIQNVKTTTCFQLSEMGLHVTTSSTVPESLSDSASDDEEDLSSSSDYS